MTFEVSAKLTYKAISASTLILNIQPFESAGQVLAAENFQTVPGLTRKELNSPHGEKRFTIIDIPNPGEIAIDYSAKVTTDIILIPAAELEDVPISKMPATPLFYLNPSRYCQSDRLYRFAYNKFGHINHAFQKVIAIRDWIYTNVAYGGYTTPQTSAYDTITEQMGVCRDFAHLGIALCRALTIPARYFTCYSYKLVPPDFHACFEVYLGGHWIVVDATKLAPINGLVKIASGADATDTALASIFGNLQFQTLTVGSVLLDNDFQDADLNASQHGYSYV